MIERTDVDAAVQQIESIVAEVGEPGAELVRLLMQLYGGGLARTLEILGELKAQEAIGRLADDKLVGSLLLLHGLHPVDAASRVRTAMGRLERTLHWHDLALEGVSDNVAHIRVVRNGAGPAPNGLREAIERAVAESAPDLEGVEIEGLENPSALVQIDIAPGR